MYITIFEKLTVWNKNFDKPMLMLCNGVSHTSYINVTCLLISGKRDDNYLIEDETKSQVLINSLLIVLFIPFLNY